ncbi:MAG: iron-containing alcohol dehydrogenase, partial [Clostridiales Family XIII bacterium]|nr:iron-containing alcohol dehydrogenase [Clostridiales Family XIII bacterium]
ELVATLPPAIVASTGVDALTHAIEGYTCKIAEPITDALGLYAIELIGKNIRKATFTDDAEAKANMLVASLIAGICFGQTDVAAVHCVAEALGAVYDIPHGMANACMLPYVMEFNFVSDLDKFARIATALGEDTVGLAPRDAAMLGIEAVRVLNEDLGIPKLGATGARLEDIELVAEKAAANVSGPDNPRPITKEDYVAMLRQAFEDE